MNQTEALEVKDLARSVVEALGIITERECGECKGCGRVKNIFLPGEIGCITCKGTGKVKYVWQPKPGEWCIWGEETLLIIDIDNCGLGDYVLKTPTMNVHINQVVPILPWETIERVLIEVGYSLDLHARFSCQIHPPGVVNSWSKGGVWANTRQEAVMLAVIELGKGEMK